MKQLVLLVLCSLFIVACDENRGGSDNYPGDAVSQHFKKHRASWRKLEWGQKYSCANDSAPLSCLRDACQVAGGQFDMSKVTCHCDAGLFFNAEYAACLPPPPIWYSEKRMDMPKISLITSQGDLSHLAELEIKGVENSFNYPLSETVPTLVVLKKASEMTDNDLLQPLLTRPNTAHMKHSLAAPNILKVIQEEADIFAPDSQSIALLEDSSELSFLNAGLKLINADSSQGSPIIKDFMGDGCLSVCHVDKVYLADQMYYVDRRVLVSGALHSRNIYVSSSKKVEGAPIVISMDNSNNINFIYKINYRKLGSIGFAINAQVFSTKGLYFRELNISDNETYNKVFTARGLKAKTTARASRYTVAVCEEGVPLVSLPTNYERMVTGPYLNLNDDFSGSMWGWYENKEADPFVYLRGGATQGDIGVVEKKLDEASVSHNQAVFFSVLNSSKLATATSLNADNCFANSEKENPLLRQSYPGVVVNMSIGFSDEGQSCKERIQMLRKLTKDKLVVKAAGNDGVYACDKKIHKLAKVISVTSVAKINGRIRFVDRSARGKYSVATASFESESADRSGTSFASPVIAAIAAEIAGIYPELSVDEITKAVLLGVDFYALPVRSGGVTTRLQALAVAEFLSQNPGASVEEILFNKYQDNQDLFYDHWEWVEETLGEIL